jgi:Flp pilus assembly protein CpaB
MDKKINIKALILSLAIALVCCVLLFNYINSLQRPVEEKPKVVLLVASRNIEAGELITQAEINAIEVSEDSMPWASSMIARRLRIFTPENPSSWVNPFALKG